MTESVGGGSQPGRGGVAARSRCGRGEVAAWSRRGFGRIEAIYYIYFVKTRTNHLRTIFYYYRIDLSLTIIMLDNIFDATHRTIKVELKLEVLNHLGIISGIQSITVGCEWIDWFSANKHATVTRGRRFNPRTVGKL